MKRGSAYRVELLQGTLDPLTLQLLRCGAQHGFGISQTTWARSGEVLQVDTGSLCPARHRLERENRISSVWGGQKMANGSKPIT
jgi:DNA-binding PadR family transcriptional regulator